MSSNITALLNTAEHTVAVARTDIGSALLTHQDNVRALCSIRKLLRDPILWDAVAFLTAAEGFEYRINRIDDERRARIAEAMKRTV
jgi:hypothetical protein